jgi:hypothetical protein
LPNPSKLWLKRSQVSRSLWAVKDRNGRYHGAGCRQCAGPAPGV